MCWVPPTVRRGLRRQSGMAFDGTGGGAGTRQSAGAPEPRRAPALAPRQVKRRPSVRQRWWVACILAWRGPWRCCSRGPRPKPAGIRCRRRHRIPAAREPWRVGAFRTPSSLRRAAQAVASAVGLRSRRQDRGNGAQAVPERAIHAKGLVRGARRAGRRGAERSTRSPPRCSMTGGMSWGVAVGRTTQRADRSGRPCHPTSSVPSDGKYPTDPHTRRRDGPHGRREGTETSSDPCETGRVTSLWAPFHGEQGVGRRRASCRKLVDGPGRAVSRTRWCPAAGRQPGRCAVLGRGTRGNVARARVPRGRAQPHVSGCARSFHVERLRGVGIRPPPLSLGAVPRETRGPWVRSG